ncbi:MAG: tellurite resistance TerB family protein [Cohaesibacteraceae bacterium]|nr:tellurite resistance TerB family protein [Cohaesibacteraceae bacterium]MBL4876896.1 tellurite resistance TerB family protein [Cohaesibacteraceae bacterium]
MTTSVSLHEALIYVMVTMSAADRTMTDSEFRKIGEEVQNLPLFEDFSNDRLVGVAEDCGTLLSKDEGLDGVLNIVANSLPEKFYETAYALAVEVAAADLHVEQEELRYLEMLRDRLNISSLAIAAIEHSARVRYRVT